MRRSRSSRVALLALAGSAAGLCAAVPAASAQAIGRPQGAEFLLLPVGAQATALGQAAAAAGGTTEAIFWNPAGLAALPRGEFAVHHFNAFFGAGDAIALALRSPRLGTVAVAAYVVDYGDMELTPPDGGPVSLGRITPRNIALALSYGTDVGAGAAIGVTYKLVQFRVDCSGDCANVPAAVGTTHAVDVGLRYAPAALPIVLGASVRNLGFPLQVQNSAQADPLPTRLSVGVAYEVVRTRDGDAERFDVRVLADVQGSVGRGGFSPVTLVGVESGVGDLVRLRGGYAFTESAAKGPSIGLGMALGSLAIDLARVFFASDDLGEKEPFHVSFRATF